jgi:AraC family transcriptional regulator, regulatory protein of adaptative response / methylated-DNA-[protein]-cysteine methyltransferase
MNAIPELAARERAFETDETRWQAVQGRNPVADGRFVYAVATTGIYCRPSCGARPARRDNVSFYRAPADAEAAGFRACKRCRPDGPSLSEIRTEAVARACRLIDEAEEPPSLEDLARAAGVSRFHFHRVFKEIVGVTPRAYAGARRRALVQKELSEAPSVTAAIYGAGYNASSRFYENVEAKLGMSPSAYRKGGRDSTIRFALGECSLGSILVAASEKGVCAIQFADDPDTLLRDLQDRFPEARLIGGDPAFERMVAKVVGFVEAPAQGFDLPLDVRGTAFQQRVWQALCEIPNGSTASYAEIAERIGRPKAVRAVAQACASNALAVAIPCHRVVRTDGALSGYRWGIERKRALLDREARPGGRSPPSMG